MKVALSRILAFPIAEFLARLALAARHRFGPRNNKTTIVSEKPSDNIYISSADKLSTDELACALDSLRIFPSDTVMVHSSAAAAKSWGWEAKKLIDFLVDYLGTEGTLAMPAHPKLREQDGRLVYQVRRSPSTVGTLTEIFRRYPGVIRSTCPFSAAAALGRQAEFLTSEHGKSFAPHDEHSPYARLAEINGKCLCIGTDLDRMTILHVAEDVLRDEWPIPDFYEPWEATVRLSESEQRLTVHRRRPWLWWYLNLQRWQRQMFDQQLARRACVGRIPLYAADARPTIDWMVSQARRGDTIYPLAGYNRWLKLGNPPREEST